MEDSVQPFKFLAPDRQTFGMIGGWICMNNTRKKRDFTNPSQPVNRTGIVRNQIIQ